MDEELERLFPEQLRWVIGVIGLEKAVALVEQHGGTRLSVPLPERLREEHPLAQLLGHETALAFAKTFSGPDLYIPTALRFRRELRNREIFAQNKSGISVKALARAYFMSEPGINRILSKYREKPGNPLPTKHQDQQTCKTP